MVNRVLDAKRMKIKRMRRAYLKHFSRSQKGPGVLGYFNDVGDWVDMSLGSRAQSAAVPDLDRALNEHLRRRFKFNKFSPESIYARHRGLHTDLTRDGELVLARRMQSKGNAGSLQNEETFVRWIAEKSPTRELSLYMSGDTNFFVEIRVDSAGSTFYKSADYPDRHTAKAAYLNEKLNKPGRGIIWEEIVKTPKADKR